MRRKQGEADISEDMQVLKLTNNKEYDATWRRKKQSFNHYLLETIIVRRKNRFCCDFQAVTHKLNTFIQFD